MTFKEIHWDIHPLGVGERAVIHFDNLYTLSIITGWELSDYSELSIHVEYEACLMVLDNYINPVRLDKCSKTPNNAKTIGLIQDLKKLLNKKIHRKEMMKAVNIVAELNQFYNYNNEMIRTEHDTNERRRHFNVFRHRRCKRNDYYIWRDA